MRSRDARRLAAYLFALALIIAGCVYVGTGAEKVLEIQLGVRSATQGAGFDIATGISCWIAACFFAGHAQSLK